MLSETLSKMLIDHNLAPLYAKLRISMCCYAKQKCIAHDIYVARVVKGHNLCKEHNALAFCMACECQALVR